MVLTKMSRLLQTQVVRSRSCKMQREDERSKAFRTKCLKGHVLSFALRIPQQISSKFFLSKNFFELQLLSQLFHF